MALGAGSLFGGQLGNRRGGFDWTTTHFYFGYSALALVLFRLAWGCWARFFALRILYCVTQTGHRHLRNTTPAKPATGHNQSADGPASSSYWLACRPAVDYSSATISFTRAPTTLLSVPAPPFSGLASPALYAHSSRCANARSCR